MAARFTLAPLEIATGFFSASQQERSVAAKCECCSLLMGEAEAAAVVV